MNIAVLFVPLNDSYGILLPENVSKSQTAHLAIVIFMTKLLHYQQNVMYHIAFQKTSPNATEEASKKSEC